MKTLLAIACLALNSCSLGYGAWGVWHRAKGGYYQRPSQPTPEEAAANVLPRPGSSQPTHY